MATFRNGCFLLLPILTVFCFWTILMFVQYSSSSCNRIISFNETFHNFYGPIMRVPKRPVVFLQENTKFYSCTQTAIRFLERNAKFWNLYPNGHSFFYNETQNFENCNQTAIHVFATKYRILKVVPKRPFVFSTRKYEI